MARPGSSPRHPAPCNGAGCDAEIWYALVAHEPKPLRIPLLAAPDPAGTVAINPDRPWIYGRFLAAGETPNEAAGERRFRNHFDDYDKAAQFRGKRTAARQQRPAPEPEPAQLTLIPGDDIR